MFETQSESKDSDYWDKVCCELHLFYVVLFKHVVLQKCLLDLNVHTRRRGGGGVSRQRAW